MGSMTALGITNPTLLDVARKTDPDGKIATDVAEVIAQTNDFIPYLSWKEGNMATGHKSTIRSGYPAGTWRKFYGVVSEDKTETQQVTDTCGMLQNLSDVDEDLADLSGEGALRSDEDIAAVQGMTETFASTFFYGNTDTDPEKFHGLSARFDTPSTDSSKIGFNMIDGGAVDGQTDCTSVWLLGMGPMSLFNIFPKGSAAGLKMENCGLQWKYNSAQTGNLRVYRTYFRALGALVSANALTALRRVNLIG